MHGLAAASQFTALARVALGTVLHGFAPVSFFCKTAFRPGAYRPHPERKKL